MGVNRVPISEPGGGGGTEHVITPSRDPAAVCKHSSKAAIYIFKG